MNGNMQIVFGLMGGLAVFIYGMNMMSECLQKAAGERMKNILALLTRNPVMGALAGALVTAVLQSSSATTVMAIGFVSAGLMNLPQAISIIFGANIGTTMTAQIIAFNLSDYIYLIIFVGFIISFLAKSEQIKNIGSTIFAFGLLFLGIETMGSVMKPLAESPIFVDMISKVSDIPVLGVAVGTLMTLVVQSSSATIAVLQNFASQAGPDGVSSVIGLAGAIPILLGDNIGTTITAVLASIGQPRDAKRTAVAHCMFNISGTLIFIWFIGPFSQFIQHISPKGPEIEVISRQIANAHTTFNVVMTLIWVPLIAVMIKIVMFVIPDGKAQKADLTQPLYLDDKMVSQPAAALQMAAREIVHCGELVGDMLKNVGNAAKSESMEDITTVKEQGRAVSHLAERITDYFAEMFSAGVMTENQSTQTARLMQVLNDIERLNVLAVEVAQSLKDKVDKKYKYSADAMKDLQKSLELVSEMHEDAIAIISTGDLENARKLRKKSQKVMDLGLKMRKNHMERVNKGKCKASLTAPFTKLLYSIDRMGNSCVNVADAALSGLNYASFFHVTEEPSNTI